MKAPRIVTPKNSVAGLLSATFLIAALLSPALVRAQDAATLAKYDKNHNGKLDPDEIAAMQADQAKAAQTPVTNAAAAPGKVVTLNPFEVDASKDIGYYAENTLAGSRLNTNVGDLASSITVVTKQQLEDTGALNINDVFLYEANTEGANTYTPLQLNRGNAADNISGYSTDNGPTFGIATANRIRGLGSADTAQDNYPTLSRIAFDTYNTNSVEISRGPNSILFGAGTASGVVNNSSAEAVLNQQKTRVTARFGSYGAHRESVSTNIPLGSKVALFVAALYDVKEYARKPSIDYTRRQFAAITFQPFSKTKIAGSFENYDNFNNRPNFNEPADGVSLWLNSGKPGWDPVAQTITLASGVKTGPYLNSTLDPRWNATLTSNGSGAFSSSTSATYIPGITTLGNNTIFFNNGQPLWFFASSGTAGAGVNGSTAVPAATARTAAQWIAQNIYMTQSRAPFAPVPPAATGATSYSVWYNAGVTNKSIYDWTSYNAAGSNYGTQTAKSYKLELNQQIFQGLNLQMGWFRQEMFEWDHYGMGQTNAAPTLLVDTNTKLMDGRPNPFFGSPFVYDNQTDTYSSPETNNNLRGMLAYQHDFTKGEGFARFFSFLGKAQLMGLVSQQKDVINRGRWRLSFDGGDPRFLPNQNNGNIPNNFLFANSANIQRTYYMGANNNGRVTYGVEHPGEPNFGGPNKLPFGYYDWNSTQTWQQTSMSFDDNLLIAGSAQGVTNKTLNSTSFAYQGSMWGNRLVPTIGTRYDKVRVFVRSGLGLS
ncbi:MAG: TonB-dependent receptor plug domain-containing protein, partial [Pseudomonadota bacterium]